LAPTRNPYGRAIYLYRQLAQQRRPGRGTALNFAALTLGNMIAEGVWGWLAAEQMLINACRENGLLEFDGERAVRREIERVLTHGIDVWRAQARSEERLERLSGVSEAQRNPEKHAGAREQEQHEAAMLGLGRHHDAEEPHPTEDP